MQWRPPCLYIKAPDIGVNSSALHHSRRVIPGYCRISTAQEHLSLARVWFYWTVAEKGKYRVRF